MIISMKDKNYAKMTEMPIKKLVNTIALPAAFSLGATSLYQVFDMYFVARLGDSATAAIGVVSAIAAVIQAIGFTLGMGVGTVAAACLGRKQYQEAEEAALGALQIGLLLGGVIGLIGTFWTRPILEFLGGSPASIEQGIWYARILSLNAPLLIGTLVLNNLLRAEGKASVAMLVVLSGGILNIILDPVLIFGANLKVTGAAVALIVSQLYSFSLLLLLYIRKKTKIKLPIWGKWMGMKNLMEVLKNGMSGFFRQGLAFAAVTCINRSASSYGDEAVAAMSVSTKLYMVIFTLVIGMGQALQTITGYHYGTGNGKEDRMKKAFFYCLYRGVTGMLIAAVAVYVLAPDLTAIFAKGREATRKLGAEALRYQSFAFPFMVLPVMCNMVYQGQKKYVKSTLIAALRQGIFFLPVLYVFAGLWGMKGIMAAQPAADIFTCAAVLFLLIRNNAAISPASVNPADKHHNSS